MIDAVPVGSLSPTTSASLAVLTQLGDVWLLFTLLALLYWLGDERVAADPRRSAGLLVALGIGASALLVGAKAAFAVPRPPGAATATPPPWLPTPLTPAFLDAATADGFRFPSGHALMSTVVYGGMASLLDVWTRRRRALVAGGLVTLIGATRVALGVHHPVDVLAGVALGLAFLGAGLRLASGRPGRAFDQAVGLAVLALGVALFDGHVHSIADAAATLGAASGGLIAWRYPRERRVGRPLRRIEAGVGLLVAGGLWIVAYTLPLSLPATIATNAVALGCVVALPDIADRVVAHRGDQRRGGG